MVSVLLLFNICKSISSSIKFLGVHPKSCPVETSIAVFNWGEYLGEGALKKGVKISLSNDYRWLRCDIKSISLLSNVLEKQETLDELKTLIGGLPERSQLILSLYHVEELTLKEIADVEASDAQCIADSRADMVIAWVAPATAPPTDWAGLPGQAWHVRGLHGRATRGRANAAHRLAGDGRWRE